jgi:hypothetical protein
MVGGLSLREEKLRQCIPELLRRYLNRALDPREIQHQLHHAKHRHYKAQRKQ